jgi:pyrroloquinoline quinone (PQQ) biosynthesis protein C
MDHLEKLRHDTQPLREQLMAHPVYRTVSSLDTLRLFMEHHVFAVWDFMSLLKRLQQLQTGIGVPWLPKPHTTVSRFVNEIVLGEESDEDGRGGYISHFELYREAMRECGASTHKIDSLTAALGRNVGIDQALVACAAAPSITEFVRTTFSFTSSAQPHCVAAAFTFGREDVIPDMFRQCVAALATERGCGLERMRYYLARHIDLDETTHAPMAIKVMRELCADDATKWMEATGAVRTALRARITLWDGIDDVAQALMPAATTLLASRRA